MAEDLAAAVRGDSGGVSVAVRVVPRASRTAILGLYDGGTETRLKVALAAPPVDGRANEALVQFFADILGVPRSAVSLAAGEQARNKRVRIAGLSVAQAAARLRHAAS